jgi:hypothetical protein
MSNPEHFRSRAAAYRQIAQNSLDERTAGDMFEIANHFNSMADALTRLGPAPKKRQSQVCRALAFLEEIRLECSYLLAAVSQTRGV